MTDRARFVKFPISGLLVTKTRKQEQNLFIGIWIQRTFVESFQQCTDFSSMDHQSVQVQDSGLFEKRK